MKYIWSLRNPAVFIIFLAFLIIYGVGYRVIIPILLKSKNIQGSSFNQRIYLVRFVSSLLFFFIILYILKAVLKTKLTDYGIRFSFPVIGLILYVIIFPILLKYALYQSSKLSKNTYIKSLYLDWMEISKIVLSWLFYITAYEMLYRGILLFSLVPLIGKWEAIVVVTSVYFFDHISRNYYEALGAFMIGFVFGYIVLLRNSVLESITLHYLIAITTDIIILLKTRVIQS